eukprot:1600156-Pyramimonas_sp.AAC.1
MTQQSCQTPSRLKCPSHRSLQALVVTQRSAPLKDKQPMGLPFRRGPVAQNQICEKLSSYKSTTCTVRPYTDRGLPPHVELLHTCTSNVKNSHRSLARAKFEEGTALYPCSCYIC